MIKILCSGSCVASCCLLVILLARLQPSTALIEEDSKSLWHQMAHALMLVRAEDRDDFMDTCIRHNTLCDERNFQGPRPHFQWESDNVSSKGKIRFWHAYACTVRRDITLCPIDGGWSTWSPWTKCSATCEGESNQTRTRMCNNPTPVNGGAICQGSIFRSRPCVGPCIEVESNEGGQKEAEAYIRAVHKSYPVLRQDCFIDHCTFADVKKIIKDTRTSDKYWSSLSCVKYKGACPMDGSWGDWGAWSDCSVRCGAGTRSRKRTCDRPPPQFGGHVCPGQWIEQQNCIQRNCPFSVPETFTEWTEWSFCSSPCDTYGTQYSTRVCLKQGGCSMNGVLTPFINRTRPCFKGPCSQHGGWSQWTDWTDCSAGCGKGRHSRLRLCDSPYPSGGLNCAGHPLDFRVCEGTKCSMELSITAMRAKIRGKLSKNIPAEDVTLGVNDEFLTGPFNPEAERLYLSWTAWSPCTASCGGGQRKRTRQCEPHIPLILPRKCEGEVHQEQFCNIHVCPVSGGWGQWLPWTPCSTTCGVGQRHRYRECSNPLPKNGGFCPGDSSRVETCLQPVCPEGIAWSEWSQWSMCSETCGGGLRVRERSRVKLLTTSNEFTEPERIEEKLSCNTQPCPENGGWAAWGEWSKCSAACGMGLKERDRTCTDPAPARGGAACVGQGTDVTHCYSGPCRDEDDKAIHLEPTSWIRYPPYNRPEKFLTIYLHFKPISADGMILHRYRKCNTNFDDNDNVDEDSKHEKKEEQNLNDNDLCRLLVDVQLKDEKPMLRVHAGDASLTIASNVSLALGKWHELLVEVLGHGASLRVNDRERVEVSYPKTLTIDLDFDAYMIIGFVNNHTYGFTGSICTLSINFRTQELFAGTDWDGQGISISHHSVSVESINPIVQMPHLHGVYYSSLRVPKAEQLSLQLTVAVDEPDGLLLYVPGEKETSFLSLGMRRAKLDLCLQCGFQPVCHLTEPFKVHQWYHVAVTVDKQEVELRVDQGKAAQFTCSGAPFVPKHYIHIGGRDAEHWRAVEHLTNYTKGFYGAIGSLLLNGQSVSFRHAPLLSRDGRLNPDGYSKASRITPVFEHKSSMVSLHCEITATEGHEEKVHVMWLYSDTVIKPSALVEIVEPVGEHNKIGTLLMQPEGHKEGLYSCLVSRDGRLVLTHVYPLFRLAEVTDTYENEVEWVSLELLAIFLALMALMLLAYRNRKSILILLGLRKKTQKDMDENAALLKKELELTSDSGTAIMISENFSDTKLREEPSHNMEPRHLSMTPRVTSRRYLTVRGDMVKLGEDRHPTYSQNVPVSQYPLETASYTGYSCDLMSQTENIWPDSTAGFENAEESYKDIKGDEGQFDFSITAGVASRRPLAVHDDMVRLGEYYPLSCSHNGPLCQCPPELVTCNDVECTCGAMSAGENVWPDSPSGFENAKAFHGGFHGDKDKRYFDAMSLTENFWPDSAAGYGNTEASHAGIQGDDDQFALNIQTQDFNVSQPSSTNNPRRRLSSMVDFSIHGMSSPDIIVSKNPSRKMNKSSRLMINQSRLMKNHNRPVTKRKHLSEDNHYDLCHGIGEDSRNQSQRHEKVKGQAPWKKSSPKRHLTHLQQGRLFPRTSSKIDLHTQKQQEDPLARVSLNCEQQQKQQLQNTVQQKQQKLKQAQQKKQQQNPQQQNQKEHSFLRVLPSRDQQQLHQRQTRQERQVLTQQRQQTGYVASNLSSKRVAVLHTVNPRPSLHSPHPSPHK